MQSSPSDPSADPGIERRVRASFDRQSVMTLFGASLERVAAGEVELRLRFDPRLTQQHGFLHAGVIGTVLDSACGYAAYTLMPPDAGILTIEYKINLLAPAAGEWFRFVGRVRKPGRNIIVCDGDAWAVSGQQEKLVATMTATEMTLTDRPGIQG